MSPLWRDEIAIYISPQRITLGRMKRGLRPHCIASLDCAVVGERTAGWEAAIGVLGGCLVDTAWNDAVCRIVIANHWIRYALIPWSDALGDDAERRSLAQHRLARIYGEVVSQWSVALSETPPGHAQVASAIPAQLLEEICRHTESNGLKIRSIQPHLVAAYNSWRGRLPGARGWFVTLDEGSLAAVHLRGGELDEIRAVRTDRHWARELKRLHTESRMAGLEQDQVYVDAPPALHAPLGESLHWLDAQGGDAAPPLALLTRMYA